MSKNTPSKQEKITKKPKKTILKQIELVGRVASALEDLPEGKLINISKFSENVAHIETVKAKLLEAEVWQAITKKIKLHKDGEKIIGIEKIKPEESKEEIEIIKKRLDLFESKFDNLDKKIEGFLNKIK